jgi:hypothetical protein
MGYAMVVSACLSCKKLFSYNPHKVPSIRRTPDSPREPVCASCMTYFNIERAKRGLPPLAVHPEAYNAIEENEP